MTSRFSATDREIVGIAVPALGSLAIDPLLTLADTAFVARLGTIELAALGVDAAIISFAFFAFNFLAFVTTPLVAKALGRGDLAEAKGIVGTALSLAVMLGIPMTILVIVLAPTLVEAMGAQPEVAGPAVEYLRVRALATTAVLVVTAAHGSFRGHKDTRSPLVVAFGVNVLNLVLDPLLIFGAGLGLEGAAWATVAAQWIGAVWFLLLIRSRQLATRPRRLGESIPLLATIGKNGGLLMVRTAFLLSTFTFAASVAARLGAVEIAAHQLVVQLFFLSAMVADSLEIAGQAMVGEEAGRGDRGALGALNRRLLGWGLAAGVFLMVAVGLGRFVLRYLASDPVVGDLAVSVGGIAALLEPVGALVFVADGIFVGMLALGSMALSTATGAVVAIGLMALTPMGQSLQGIWWSLGVFLAARGLVFLLRYRVSADRAVRS